MILNPQTVQYWWQHYQNDGLKAAVDSGQRGHEVGKSRTLGRVQEWMNQELISEKMPDRLELSFALWTPAYSPELNPDEHLNGDRKVRILCG